MANSVVKGAAPPTLRSPCSTLSDAPRTARVVSVTGARVGADSRPGPCLKQLPPAESTSPDYSFGAPPRLSLRKQSVLRVSAAFLHFRAEKCPSQQELFSTSRIVVTWCRPNRRVWPLVLLLGLTSPRVLVRPEPPTTKADTHDVG